MAQILALELDFVRHALLSLPDRPRTQYRCGTAFIRTEWRYRRYLDALGAEIPSEPLTCSVREPHRSRAQLARREAVSMSAEPPKRAEYPHPSVSVRASNTRQPNT
jgi:hypothetical protein